MMGKLNLNPRQQDWPSVSRARAIDLDGMASIPSQCPDLLNPDQAIDVDRDGELQVIFSRL